MLSTDEQAPQIGPNFIAQNPDLGKTLWEFINRHYFQRYYMQQQVKHREWRRADEAWRSRMAVSDLDLKKDEFVKGNIEGAKKAGTVNDNDGIHCVFTPSTIHEQMDAILNMGCSVAWEDGLPVRARKPDTHYENPLYNPQQQSVDAANEEFDNCARDIGLEWKYRIGLGHFVKYGHAWALTDLKREYESYQEVYPLPAQNPQMLHAALFGLRQIKGRPEDSLGQDALGRPVAIYNETTLKVFQTDYQPLDVDAVFIDQLIPAMPIERQPCPIVRTHLTRWELRDNRYDPQMNPFGWANIEMALSATPQTAQSQPDEASRLQRLKEKGIDGLYVRPEDTEQQLWTCFPLLAIGPDGTLDEGLGLDCPACQGKMSQPVQDPQTGQTSQQDCPACQGTGKIYPKAERYVVQFFGPMYTGSNVTCLRCQRNPTAKDKVPLLFAAHLIEDTAGAIPQSKVEISMDSFRQLATSHNQFRESKETTIRRPWMKRFDSPSFTVDCNKPGVTIPWESSPNEAVRVQGNNYDESVTLLPYIQTMDGQVQKIFGVNDIVMGEISQGRRAASEINLANSASRMPLTLQIDSFNRQHIGQWGQQHLDNWEVYGDRTLLRKRTGRTTWGKIELFTQAAGEFLESQALLANIRYILEATAQDPSMQGVRPTLWGECFKQMGLDIDMSALDGGQRAGAIEAMGIVAKILGNGQLQPPSPADPHQIYLTVFNEALRLSQQDEDDYWFSHGIEFRPLLMQRIQMQQELFMQQQQAQMQQQLAMQFAQQHTEAKAKEMAKPNPHQVASPSKPAQTTGQQAQQNQ
jgi:hypothetical protein